MDTMIEIGKSDLWFLNVLSVPVAVVVVIVLFAPPAPTELVGAPAAIVPIHCCKYAMCNLCVGGFPVTKRTPMVTGSGCNSNCFVIVTQRETQRHTQHLQILYLHYPWKLNALFSSFS